VDIAGARFGFSKRDLHQAIEHQDILIAQQFDAAAHVHEPLAKRPAFSRRQALEKDRERLPKW
jgi:hypothetical protein